MTNSFVCALTGHRYMPNNFDEKYLCERLSFIIDAGCSCFLCGMAEGFDLVALKCLIEIKKKKEIYLKACIPFPEQDRFYREKNKRFYKRSLSLCDEIYYISQNYSKGNYHARNRYMVDSSDKLLAYCVKRDGGSFHTVNYALRLKKEVIYL